MLPKHREDDLLIEELSEETLIYDRKRFKGHCLNRIAGLVWKHCDGKTSVAKLAEILRKKLKQEIDEEVVWLALEQLGKAHLLQEQPESPELAGTFNRRDLVKKLAGISAAALVASVGIPTAMQAACTSQPPCNIAGAGCQCNQQCCPAAPICRTNGPVAGRCKCSATGTGCAAPLCCSGAGACGATC